MSADITRGQLERIVAAANTAPSADNCQPWDFAWDGEALAIGHDPERATHVLDHCKRMSCLAEAMTIPRRAGHPRSRLRRLRRGAGDLALPDRDLARAAAPAPHAEVARGQDPLLHGNRRCREIPAVRSPTSDASARRRGIAALDDGAG